MYNVPELILLRQSFAQIILRLAYRPEAHQVRFTWKVVKDLDKENNQHLSYELGKIKANETRNVNI